MSEILSSLLGLTLLIGGGAGVRLLANSPSNGPAFALSSSIVLGVAACGIVGPLAELLRLPVPTFTAAALLALFVCGLVIRARRGDRVMIRLCRADLHLLVLLVPIGLVAYRAFTSPMLYGDEVYVWGYKANAITTTRAISPEAWSARMFRGGGYPLAIPVSGSVAGLLDASFGAVTCRSAGLLFFIAFAFALPPLLGPLMRPLPSAVASGAIASLPIAMIFGGRFVADLVFTAGIALLLFLTVTRPHSRCWFLHLAALPLLKLEGFPCALLVGLCAAAEPSVRSTIRSCSRIGAVLAVASAPWCALFIMHGLRPVTAETWADSSRSISLTSVLTDPILLIWRGATVMGALALEILPVSSAPSTNWCEPSAFGWIAPGLVLLVAAGGRASTHASSTTRCVAVACAVFVSHSIAIAVAPSFEWQLAAVRSRAALHCLPAVLLLAYRRTGSAIDAG